MPTRTIVACLAVWCAFTSPALAVNEDLTVQEILERALETHRHNEEERHETRYDYILTSRVEELDDEGNVDKVEVLRYRSDHLTGVAYERLVSKDGKPLDEKELREEDERRAKLEKKLAEGRARHDVSDERVVFDEALVSRFDVVLEGVEKLGDTTCYHLAFAPKPGKLPVERRIDRVLNKSVGSLLIDTDSFEIARLEFELTDKVRLWLGIAGSISDMRGNLERRPVDGTVWLPGKFELYMRARMLFRKLHLQQEVQWADFEPRLDGLSAAENGN